MLKNKLQFVVKLYKHNYDILRIIFAKYMYKKKTLIEMYGVSCFSMKNIYQQSTLLITLRIKSLQNYSIYLQIN